MTTTLKMKVVTSVINGGFRIENFDNDIFLYFQSILFWSFLTLNARYYR